MTEFLTTFEARVDPAHTALLVIDMQNDFCAEGGYLHAKTGADMGAAVTVAENIMGLVRRARAAGLPVFWIVANYDPDKIGEAHLTKSRAGGRGAVCCASGSWGAELFRVEPAEGEPVVVKHSYDGFLRTGLDEALRARGVRTVVATGVATDICVEGTVRSAFHHGYHVVVAEDCVASLRPDAHAAALAALGRSFGDVVPAGSVAAAWSGRVGVESAAALR